MSAFVDQSRTLRSEIDRLGKSPVRRLQSLGRLAPGTMNKTEAKYAAHLDRLKLAGDVLWYGFEAMTFKLAHDCRLTPDFIILRPDMSLAAHDVKGSPAIVSDDAKVKMRVAANLMPLPFFYAFPRKGGGWDLDEVHP